MLRVDVDVDAAVNWCNGKVNLFGGDKYVSSSPSSVIALDLLKGKRRATA